MRNETCIPEVSVALWVYHMRNTHLLLRVKQIPTNQYCARGLTGRKSDEENRGAWAQWGCSEEGQQWHGGMPRLRRCTTIIAGLSLAAIYCYVLGSIASERYKQHNLQVHQPIKTQVPVYFLILSFYRISYPVVIACFREKCSVSNKHSQRNYIPNNKSFFFLIELYIYF